MIRITYVTITFNAAKVLQRTLDSVLQQDYPNIVHLIRERAPHTSNIRARQGHLRCNEQRLALTGWRLRVLSKRWRFPARRRHRQPHS